MLIGLSPEYVAIELPSETLNSEKNNLEILDMKNGFLIKAFQTGSSGGHVQFSHGRLAFQGILLTDAITCSDHKQDITVMDMKSWDVIFRVSKDFGFQNTGRFLLRKRSILFFRRGEVVAARFWI